MVPQRGVLGASLVLRSLYRVAPPFTCSEYSERVRRAPTPLQSGLFPRVTCSFLSRVTAFPVTRVNTNATYRLDVEVRGKDIIVSLPSARFTAVYYKPAGQPQLILRQRSKCDDYDLLANVYQAALRTARRLGWMV